MHLVLPPTTMFSSGGNISGSPDRPLSAPPAQPSQFPNYLQQPSGLRFRGSQYVVNGTATHARMQFQISPPQLLNQIARLRQQVTAPGPYTSQRLSQGPQPVISPGHR